MYKFESRIRYSESDRHDRLTIVSLLDYFQDCSIFHSEDLGLGVDYLRKKNLAWVLNSWQIDVSRYPNMGERVYVCTAPYAFKGFLGYRNFLMETAEGERLAVANTIWTLLDLQTGKPVNPPEEMKLGYVCEEKLDMEYLPRKIVLAGEAAACEAIRVCPHHLDTNNHVNNGQYLRMALDVLPDEMRVSRLRVEYKAQAYLGDTIYPKRYTLQPGYGVELLSDTGKVYAVIDIK